jgi:hypothetical protein
LFEWLEYREKKREETGRWVSHSRSFLSHSFFSQSFFLFSVILSFLSHSFFSQSFFLFSVILSFLSHSFYPQSFPQPDPTCRPRLPPLSSPAQLLPEIPGEPLSLGPHAKAAPPPYKRNFLSPRTLTPALQARRPPAPPPFFLRRADASASPSTGHSVAPRTTTSPAKASPRHPKAPRGQHRSPTPQHQPNFPRKPSPVSCSAVGIPRRRCIPAHLDPLTTSTGVPGADLRQPRTPATSASPLPAEARSSPPPDVVVFHLPSQLQPPQPLGELRLLSLVLLHQMS